MLCFDIGSNRGEFTKVALDQGYQVIALEPSSIYTELVKNFIYSKNAILLKYAVSDKDYESVEFYECVEDGLSTLNLDWLTDESMPYNGKSFHTVHATTITIDTLAKKYGEPDLIKIDVEGSEWSVFRGMTKKYGELTFEWTLETLDEHEKQLKYLMDLGYKQCAPQFIENHLSRPEKYYPINDFSFSQWVEDNKEQWTNDGWKVAGLRPTADVGMIWLR